MKSFAAARRIACASRSIPCGRSRGCVAGSGWVASPETSATANISGSSISASHASACLHDTKPRSAVPLRAVLRRRPRPSRRLLGRGGAWGRGCPLPARPAPAGPCAGPFPPSSASSAARVDAFRTGSWVWPCCFLSGCRDRTLPPCRPASHDAGRDRVADLAPRRVCAQQSRAVAAGSSCRPVAGGRSPAQPKSLPKNPLMRSRWATISAVLRLPFG